MSTKKNCWANLVKIIYRLTLHREDLTGFFFNDTATTEIYTLSLHDALPIFEHVNLCRAAERRRGAQAARRRHRQRSEEHTSELQSQSNLVCRLLLEKKKGAQVQKLQMQTSSGSRYRRI